MPRIPQYFSSESFNEANSATDLLKDEEPSENENSSNTIKEVDNEVGDVEEYDYNQKYVGDDPEEIGAYSFKISEAYEIEVSPVELRANKRQKQRTRQIICTVGLLLLVVLLGALLGVVTNPSTSASSNSDPAPVPREIPSSGSTLAPTLRTSAPTGTCLKQLQPFPSSNPTSSWSVMAIIADRCMNYAGLDCFSKGVSASAALMGATLSDGAWYFNDPITVRSIRSAESSKITLRLETRHAHDPFRDSRAFVYQMTVNSLDNCLEAFTFFEVNSLDGTRRRCSSSLEVAANHSVIVSRFLANPTQFVTRNSKQVWVFETPAAVKNIQTADVDISQTFLIGFQDPNNTIPQFLVRSRPQDPMDQVLLTDSLLVGANCPMSVSWLDQVYEPLSPRILASPDSDGSGETSNGTCSSECLKENQPFDQINECIATCLSDQDVDVGLDEDFEDRRRLMTTEDNHEEPLGDFAEIEFDPSTQLLQAILATKLSLDQDEDEDIRECLVGNRNVTYDPSDPLLKRNVKTVLDTLVDLKQQVSRVVERLELLETTLVKAFNYMLVHVQGQLDTFKSWESLRTSAMADLQLAKLFADSPDNVQLATNLLNDISKQMEPSFQSWKQFFTAAAWTGSSADLATVTQTIDTLQRNRKQALTLNLVLDRYLIPVILAKGSSNDINSAVWQATLPLQKAVQAYSKLTIVFTELGHAVTIATESLAMEQLTTFEEDVNAVQQYLADGAHRLRATMNSQVSQDIHISIIPELPLTVRGLCNVQTQCFLGRCRSVSPTLAQTFSFSSSLNSTNCSSAMNVCKAVSSSTRSSVAADCETDLFIPQVVRSTKVMLVREALVSFSENNDQLESGLDFALSGWGQIPPAPEVVLPIVTANFTRLLLQTVAQFSAFALPSSTVDGGIRCLFDSFEETVLLCAPFDGVTAVLTEFCNLAGGSPCEIDANCASSKCLDSTCCAQGQAHCLGVCIPPSGQCFVNTNEPSAVPSLPPTLLPSKSPTKSIPTSKPTASPTPQPTKTPQTGPTPPSFSPTTSKPSKAPTTSKPTSSPKEFVPLPTVNPTLKPTKKGTPTKRPTKKPRTRPSKAPTVPAPTKSPIRTASPTHLPTVSPTLRPTLAPVASLCERPARTCEAMKTAGECSLWSGCGWNTDFNICWTQDCSEFTCKIKQYTFIAGGALMPGCRTGDVSACDRQRQRAFESLGLAKDCAATFLSTKDGGAWIGKERSAPIYPSHPRDIFVSATSGSDSNLGTRTSPFKTIEKALVESRKLTPVSKAKIILLPGEPHRISTTIRLGPADSGLALLGETDVATGAKPRLTAEISLTGSKWEDVGGGIIKTKLTDVVVAQIDLLSMLFIEDAPAIRARYPNLDDPLGYKYGASGPNTIKGWTRSNAPTPALSKRISRVIIPADDPNVRYPGRALKFNKYSLAFGGACSHFDPPASYFCEPTHDAFGGCAYTLPGAVQWVKNPIGKVFANASTAFFHTLHWYGWGLWTFQVKSQTPGQIVFARGGWQEARGDCGVGGGAWYIENTLELLDNPNEFFVDIQNKMLYYFPDSPGKNPLLNPNVKVDLSSSIRRFIEVVGTSKAVSVKDITIRNIEFFGAYPTHMDRFIVPSGGDWSIHRGGAVYFESVEESRVQESQFTWCAGNALFLWGHQRDISIELNDFYAIGSSAIALVGDPNFESAEPWKISDFAQHVRIYGNIASHTGLIVKQSAATFVTIAKEVVQDQNVFFSGPRGGIVMNDGFGGGHQIRRNVVFQFVLETNDHGPIDTWDRQQYEEPIRAPCVLEDNLVLGTLTGPKGIDFDDGAYNWISQNNVVVWGYQKFKGSHIVARNNLILYPMASSCAFKTPQTRAPANWIWENNTCVSYRPPYGSNGAVADISPLCSTNNLAAKSNTYYYLGQDSEWPMCGTKLTWGQWRSRYGQDTGSSLIKTTPPTSDMEMWVKQKLSWVQTLLSS